MTIGDKDSLYGLLKQNTPPWFGEDTPVLDAILKGTAETDSYIYSLISDTALQTRISTATGYMLDYVSQDFFGDKLPRKPDESDTAFRNRIQAYLLPERCTRKGIATILKRLTGREPVLIEGFEPTDCGAYDASFYYDAGFGYGWDYDDPQGAYTGIIYAFRPRPAGLYGLYGYDEGYFGYDFQASNAYWDTDQAIISVSDSDIQYAVDNSKVYGTKIYLYILD